MIDIAMRNDCSRSKNFIKRIEKFGANLEFDDTSKIVFISDVHRGDGGYSDSLRQNRNIYKAAINYYLRNDYTLIELGDGDELWKNKNLSDIAYNYKDIFKILTKFNEKNKLYLVFGNYDMIKSDKGFILKQERIFKHIGKRFGRDMLNLYKNVDFKEGVVLKYLPSEKNILAFHGHQVDYMNCNLWKLSRFLVRYIWRPMERIAGFKEPISPSNNYDKGTKIDIILEKIAKKERKIIICGHTHNDIFPKVSEGLYFNDGCCVFPSSVTTIEIKKGLISLVKWKIEVDSNNTLFVKKNIIGGPERIEKYFEYARNL